MEIGVQVTRANVIFSMKMGILRYCRAFNHPRNWKRRIHIFFLESPLETSIWLKCTSIGLFLMLHPAAFRDTPAWSHLSVLGDWFFGNAPLFVGLIAIFVGLCHAVGMCARITIIRQFACFLSATLWWSLAYSIFEINPSDPAGMVLCVAALYSIYVFFLVSLGYTSAGMRVTEEERELLFKIEEEKRVHKP